MPYGVMHSEQPFTLTVQPLDVSGDRMPPTVLRVPAQHLLCFAGDLWHGGRDGPPRAHMAFTPDAKWDSAPSFE